MYGRAHLMVVSMPRGLKHVLIVNDFAYINGGQAKVAIETARLLAQAGIGVTFFAGCGPIDPALDMAGIETICLHQHDILTDPNRLRAMGRGIWNRSAAKALQALTARFDPASTVLHCHGYAKALSPSIGPVLTDGRLPTVYTMHEYFLACPNGGFYNYPKNEICTLRALGTRCLATNCDARHPTHKAWRVLRQVATWGPGRLPHKLENVIYISETQRLAMAPYLAPETRLHHLPNPVPLPDLPPVDVEKNDIFLFVGRLAPEKGGVMFAEAAKTAGVRAVFVGNGPEADAIRAANPDAVITGWQSPDRVQGWISKARALVFPSLWYEGQPLVPLEALGRGVPVIAGRWSAASEAIENGVTGVIYSTPSVDALAAALRHVGKLNRFEATHLSARTAPQAHLARLIRVYENMLAETAA